MTIQEALQGLRQELSPLYDESEAAAIARLVLENLTGWGKIDLILNRNELFPRERMELLKRYTGELMASRPVQYVLGEAWFLGMRFFVNENTLIPRPETEELVEWVSWEIQQTENPKTGTNHRIKETAGNGKLRILDIGAGSGCIPIALKKELPDSIIYSCDISLSALEIARQNARSNHTEIHFLELDFLDRSNWAFLPDFQILVSNPPYIPLGEKNSLGLHIREYEPATALFVTDDNPLVFYKAMADFAKEKSLGDARIYVEIHESFSGQVKDLFAARGFSSIEIKKDIHGKDRLIKATLLL